MKTKTLKKSKVNVVTLGCSKNLVDSEVMMGQLQANGIDVIHESKKKDFDVVIDACSFFKDIDNTEVAKRLSEMSNKPVIYLLKDDTKMIYNNKPQKYVYKSYKKGEVIYYYSQKHIVGIDFKQSNLLNGLLIINNKNKYTEVAQAIYRMRKINKGHQCTIGIVDNSKDINTLQILELINTNEEKFNDNNELLLIYQYFKCYYRKLISEKYKETDKEEDKEKIYIDKDREI
jgi:hypothetical protein